MRASGRFASPLFGVLTIVSGGVALFGGSDARAAVGDAVPFVLWFNFLEVWPNVPAFFDNVGAAKLKNTTRRRIAQIMGQPLGDFKGFALLNRGNRFDQ